MFESDKCVTVLRNSGDLRKGIIYVASPHDVLVGPASHTAAVAKWLVDNIPGVYLAFVVSHFARDVLGEETCMCSAETR